MAQLPNMSALGLRHHLPVVSTGAGKNKTPSGDSSDTPSKASKTVTNPNPSSKNTIPQQGKKRADKNADADEKEKKQQKGKQNAFKKALDEWISELISTKKLKAGKAGWVPKYDQGGNLIDPNPNESCCNKTGSFLSVGMQATGAWSEKAVLDRTRSRRPEHMRDEAELEMAMRTQREAAMRKRQQMTDGQWLMEFGAERHAQIERLKNTLEEYALFLQAVPMEQRGAYAEAAGPDPMNKLLSKRNWQAEVSRWTQFLKRKWGSSEA